MASTYTVKRGDSLSKIAKQLGFKSWQDLYALNKSIIGSNPNLIYAGQKLQTAATPATAAAIKPTTSLASQYAAPAVQNAPTSPQFEEVLPFYDAWSGIVPQASQAAASQINPELMREYSSANRNYMMGMTGSGGERFGRALAGVGDLKAATERSRQAQMQDWLNQYQQGYKEMFYNPSREAWNKAVTQGKTPDQGLTKIPTWNDLYDKYSSSYGVGETTSPFYG